MRIMVTGRLDLLIRQGRVRTSIVKEVPWAMLEPHEPHAKRLLHQSLETASGRGGIDAGEALCILDEKDWRDAFPGTESSGIAPDDEETLHIRLAARIAAWEKEQAA